MSELSRVQRWRQQQREAGKDALTIWLPREMKLYVEDMALKRHCSPSDLIQQALTTCYPLGADVAVTITDTSVTDTTQLRLMLQQELRAFFGESPLSQGMPPVNHVTDTVTDTIAHAESVAAAPPETWNVTDTVTETATDTVTDTHVQAQDMTAAALETRLVTDTVTDTTAPTENERSAILPHCSVRLLHTQEREG